MGTATSTATSTTTSTAASTVTGPTPISAAVVTTTEVSSTETMAFAGDIPSGPPWWCFGVAGVSAGGAAVVVVLLGQKNREERGLFGSKCLSGIVGLQKKMHVF